MVFLLQKKINYKNKKNNFHFFCFLITKNKCFCFFITKIKNKKLFIFYFFNYKIKKY